jgi:hypothetical protein
MSLIIAPKCKCTQQPEASLENTCYISRYIHRTEIRRGIREWELGMGVVRYFESKSKVEETPLSAQ